MRTCFNSQASYEARHLINVEKRSVHAFQFTGLIRGPTDNIDDVVLRMNEVARLHVCGDINDSCNYFDVSYFRDICEVVDEAVFLTKKACTEHIKKNAHNYNDPHTYVMTAFRCPEYERLLKILKETDWAAETTPRIVTNVNSTGKNSIFIGHVNKLEI